MGSGQCVSIKGGVDRANTQFKLQARQMSPMKCSSINNTQLETYVELL